MIDDSFVLCFNAHNEPIEFTLPPAEFGAEWRIVIDTAGEEATQSEDLRAAAKLTVDAHSTVVLQAVDGSGTRR